MKSENSPPGAPSLPSLEQNFEMMEIRLIASAAILVSGGGIEAADPACHSSLYNTARQDNHEGCGR